MNTISGQKITNFSISTGVWSNDYIEVADDSGNFYKLKVKELLKVINDVTFTVTKKKVNSYLTIEGDRS